MSLAPFRRGMNHYIVGLRIATRFCIVTSYPRDMAVLKEGTDPIGGHRVFESGEARPARSHLNGL